MLKSRLQLTCWLIIALVPFAVGKCLNQSQVLTGRADPSREESLKNFLQHYLGGKDQTTRFVTAFVRLNGKGRPQAIVYITGRTWCGTGGCLTLVLSPTDSSYRVVGRTSITRPPISVLKTSSNGWRDIGVWVQGGGIQPGYEARLRFDGRAYPGNPSIAPATPVAGHSEGQVVLTPEQNGTPLFQ